VGLDSRLSLVTRAADTALWSVPRLRHRPFDGADLVLSRVRTYPSIVPDTGNDVVDDQFRSHVGSYKELEYLLRTRQPAVVEPRYGFAFLSPLRVLFESLNPKCQRWPTARSSITALLQATHHRASGRLVELPVALSLRDFNENNFWHFFNDVYPKLILAEESRIPSNVPAIVGRRLAELPFFQETCSSIARYRPVIVQDDRTFIRVGQLYCGVTRNNDFAYFDRFLDDYENQMYGDSVNDRSARASGSAALFITRRSNRSRLVVNLNEIHGICKAMGVEVVDFECLDLVGARSRIRSAQTIIGLHGAGLTNAMFRRGLPTRMGEVLMDDHVAPEYFLLAHHWGFDYQAMLGERAGTDHRGLPSYRVEPEAFGAFVQRVRAAEPSATAGPNRDRGAPESGARGR
jgi:hypothetical protein